MSEDAKYFEMRAHGPAVPGSNLVRAKVPGKAWCGSCWKLISEDIGTFDNFLCEPCATKLIEQSRRVRELNRE